MQCGSCQYQRRKPRSYDPHHTSSAGTTVTDANATDANATAADAAAADAAAADAALPRAHTHTRTHDPTPPHPKPPSKYPSLHLFAGLRSLLTHPALRSARPSSHPAPLAPPQLGESPTLLGVTFALFPGTLTLCSPLCGKLCTRIGRPATMYLGLFTMIAGTVGFGLSNSPGLFAVTRAVQGMGAAGIMVAGTATLVSTFPQHTGLVVGLQGAVSGVAFMIGPFVGGLLHQAGGFRLPFIVMVAFCLGVIVPLLVAVHCLRVCRERRAARAGQGGVDEARGGGYGYGSATGAGSEKEEGEEEGGGGATASCAVMFNRETAVVFVGIAMGIMIPGYIDPTLGVHLLRTLGWDEAATGAAFIIPTFSFALCGGLAGALADKRGTCWCMVAGCVAGCVGFLLVGPPSFVAPGLPADAAGPAGGVLAMTTVGLLLLGAGAAMLSVPAAPAMKESIEKRVGGPRPWIDDGVSAMYNMAQVRT